ncbi:MAG: hypothetical protein Q9222_003196 [Ikaeria aurantiellina]
MLKYPQLDIADPDSVASFVKSLKKDHANVDVLINNAGVNLDMEYSPANVKKTLDTNYRGNLNMCQSFIPILSKTGRIVNVSSTGSSLSGYSKEIQDRFRSSKMTLQGLEKMMQEYQVVTGSRSDSSKTLRDKTGSSKQRSRVSQWMEIPGIQCQ